MIICKNSLWKFYYLANTHQYNDAFSVGNRLIGEENSLDNKFYKYLAFCSYYSNRYPQAISHMKASLELKTNMNVNQIITKSANSLICKNEIYKSQFVYLGGMSNWGFIEHKLRKTNSREYVRLVSKIVEGERKYNKLNKESYFHNILCNMYPSFKTVSPMYYQSGDKTNCNIDFITLRKIAGKKPENHDLAKILEINNIIESIPYTQAKELFRTIGCDKSKYQSRGLHKKNIHKEILYIMKKELLAIGGSDITLNIVERMVRLIVNKKLYKLIDPVKHYAFCHNDFHKNNILIENGECFIFDWNSYSYSIMGWDMAYYFGKFEFGFKEILEKYINIRFKGNSVDSKVGSMFYAYIQVYIWVKRLRGRPADDKVGKYFRPAMDFIAMQAEALT